MKVVFIECCLTPASFFNAAAHFVSSATPCRDSGDSCAAHVVYGHGAGDGVGVHAAVCRAAVVLNLENEACSERSRRAGITRAVGVGYRSELQPPCGNICNGDALHCRYYNTIVGQRFGFGEPDISKFA